MADAASDKGVRGRGLPFLPLCPWKEPRLNGTELSVTLGMSSPQLWADVETLQCWFTVAELSYIFSGLIITSILLNLLRFDVAGWSFKCVVQSSALRLCSRGEPVQQLKHLTRAWGAMSVNEETCSTHGMVSEPAESGIYPAWYWRAAYSSGGI